MIKLFFSTNDKGYAKAIRFFGKIKTGEAKFSHTGILIDSCSTIESLTFGLRSRNFVTEVLAKDKVEVFDLLLVSQKQSKELETLLWTQLGAFKSFYGWTKIPFQALDAIVSYYRKKPTFFFSKVFTTKWFPICSVFSSWVLYKLNMMEKTKGLSPDDLYDFVIEHPELFAKNIVLSNV